jgi:ABC-type nitrate/sulfonate/bicarbonate transport system ATPase subunit
VTSLLEIRGVSKRFGDLEVLHDVTFNLGERETVALLGPSGCGKTTLLRILLRLETGDGGDITGTLDRAGYLPQGGLLFPWKTVIENAELPPQIRGVDRAERRATVAEHLPAFGLTGFEAAYPHELSGGMRQRVALLRALMTGCPILILDEPFGALDVLTRHRMQDWLAELLERLDRTMLFVTHDLEEAVALAERVVVLTDRPAVVLGEHSVPLGASERTDRLGGPFLAARDALLALIHEGSADARRGEPI